MSGTIDAACAWLESVGTLLRTKNAAYGDSIGNPVSVFAKADAATLLRARIDDKLSRVARGQEAGEDVLRDLVGYLALLSVVERQSAVVERPPSAEAPARVFATPPPRFRVGDRVRCVDAPLYSNLNVGSEYTVADVTAYGYVAVEGSDYYLGRRFYYLGRRFELVTP